MLRLMKKNKKLILIPVSVILAIAVVLGVVISDVNTTLAKATLPGVESIIIRNNNDNPYTILEVVPDYDDARLGYLIGGEEPTHDGKARSIKDMPSSDERTEKIKLETSGGKVNIPANLNETVTFVDTYTEYGPTATTIPENKRTFEIRGSFFDAGAGKGNYQEIDEGTRFTYVGTPENHKLDGTTDLFSNAITIKNVFYTKYAVFNKKAIDQISSVPRGYSLSLKNIYVDGYEPINMPNNLSIDVSGSVDNTFYSGQYFVAKKVEFASTSSFSLMSNNPEGVAVPSVSPSATPEGGGVEPTLSPSTGSEVTVTPTTSVETEGGSEGSASSVPEGGEETTPESTATPTPTPTSEPIATTPEGEVSSAKVDSELSSFSYVNYMPIYGAGPVPTNVDIGDSIFTKVGDNYSYKGYSFVDDADGILKIKLLDNSVDSFDYTKEYYIVTEADANSAQESLLYVESVSPVTNSIYKLDTTYDAFSTSEFGDYRYLLELGNLDAIIKSTHFYVAAADDLGYKYVGDNNDKYLFDADYSLEPLVDPIVYTGGFTNNEWFKKYVFDLDDSQIDDMIIDVKTVTYSDLTEELVDEADFVYFAGVQSKSKLETTPGPYIGDLSEDVSRKILSRVCSSEDGLPIVINRSLFLHNKKTDNDINSEPCLRSLDKLVLTLLQNNIQIPSDAQWNDYIFWTNAKKTIRGYDNDTNSFTSGGYVNGNLFVFDDYVYDTSGNLSYPDTRMLISNAFIKQDLFSEAERGAVENYKLILDEINSENFYLEVAGKSERIRTDITPAAAFRYIINFGDHRNVTKTSLRVLDLEPYDFSQLSDTDRYKKLVNPSDGSELESIDVIEEVDSICLDNRAENDPDVVLNKTKWLVDNLVSQFAGNQDKISVDIMGSREFIGRNIDLNANYDLIYIGMDTTVMNTEIATVDGKVVKKANTIYNDTDMNGLVYAHVGDKNYTSSNDVGTINGTFRLSGNDFTSDKVRELKEFVEAGYAVILSDKCLVKNSDGGYSVNTGLVDKSSNMYKFLSDVVLYRTDGNYKYFGKNVRLKSDFESETDVAQANRDDFSRYLSISKLNLEYSASDLPLSYNHDDGSQTYLPIDSDGVYRLKYKITLSKDAAVGIADTSYDCKLYIDTNVDGRYHVNECMTGLTIKDAGGSEMYVDDSGRYHLSPGHSYEVVKEIPDGYTGFLSWKLEFLENENINSDIGEFSKVRNSITGYCAVPCGVNKPEIKILQLIKGDGTNNFDLSNAAMDTYYSQVPDYKISVSQMTFTQYIDKNVTGGYPSAETSYIDFLNSYDMIVMGFADMYNTGANDTRVKSAVLAIREYTLSGRSILFTHDLTSFTLSGYKAWGNYITPYLRDVQGMDRYDWVDTASSYPIPDDDKYKYESKYDMPELNGNNTGEYTGYTTSTILDKNWGTKLTLSEISRYSNKKYHNTSNLVSKVSKLNGGQITEYPFKIEDTLDVSKTHGQYLQLNMDTDSRDEFNYDDIVVWYTLSNDAFYDSVPMDGRNNYYIFNKGNITYTGSGHSNVTSDGEKKLFVNTLVAAYRTGLHAPKVYYKEAEYKTSATITSKYIPYDTAINGTEVVGYVGNTLDINFLVSNINLQNSNALLSAKYYTDATAADATLCLDGKYYKEIHPLADKFIINIPVGKDIQQEAYAKPNSLKNDFIYSASFTYADLGLNNTTGIRPTGAANIYIRLGYEELIDSTDASNTLKGDESMTKLSVTTTQLFELK